MGSCLTISHACLSCLLSGLTLFWSDLLVAGKMVSWERWDNSEYGRWERRERWESSELGSWEGSGLGKWERWEDSKGSVRKHLTSQLSWVAA